MNPTTKQILIYAGKVVITGILYGLAARIWRL